MLTLCRGWATTAPAADLPWQAIDYGPFLTATIEAPEPRTNIAGPQVFGNPTAPGWTSGGKFNDPRATPVSRT